MMNKIMRETYNLMIGHGFYLVRQRKHLIFRHGVTGQTVCLPKTPSDHRHFRNVSALTRKFV